MPITDRTTYTNLDDGDRLFASRIDSFQSDLNALQDVLAKKPWFSIAENAYSGSAAGNGTTDQTSDFADIITDAANESRGGNVLVTPGSHRLTNGGAVGSDGYGLRLLDNVTLWLMPGARIFCDSEGKSPIYANAASNVAVIALGANTLIDGQTYNVGLCKMVGCTGGKLLNLTGRNGRVGVFDLIDCADFLVDNPYSYADGDLETANTDTRAGSVRASATGTVSNVVIRNHRAEGYTYGLRVMVDAGGAMKGVKVQGAHCANQSGTAGYGISLEGMTGGVQIDDFTIEHCDGLGLQLLGANRCQIGRGIIRSAGQAGVELFGSSYNQFTQMLVDSAGRLASYWSYELRALSGVGSTNNRFVACDDQGSSQAASFIDTVSALSTNNRLIGCSFLETISLNASSTQTAAA